MQERRADQEWGRNGAVRLLNIKHVIAMTGLSEATLYRGLHAGWFPAGRKVNPAGSVRWLESDVVGWIEGLPVATYERAEAARQ